MDDAVNIWMCFKDLVEILLFPDVGIEELRSLAADELNAIDYLFRSIVEVVRDHDFVTCLQQCEGSEGSNIAAAPGKVVSLTRDWQKECDPYPVTSTEPTAILVTLSCFQMINGGLYFGTRQLQELLIGSWTFV